MHEPDRAEARRFVFYASEPGLHFRSVGVGAIPIDDLDPRMKRNVISEYLENWPSFDHPSPECVLRLEAHHQNGVAGVARALRQVMQNSPGNTFGNAGTAWLPWRFVNNDGIRTLVRKFRLCQSRRGRSRTRVELFVCAPLSEDWRTTFLRLFFAKGIGTAARTI